MDQDETTPGSKKRGLTTVAIVVVIALIAVSVMLFSKKKDTDDVATTSPAANSSVSPAAGSPTPAAATSASAYKDGSYNATGSYSTPGGTEAIKVTLTVRDGAVTTSDVVSRAQSPEAVRYQKDFISGYKQFVVGKKLDDIAVSNVSGSSLTPKGFADALTQIKAEAKA